MKIKKFIQYIKEISGTELIGPMGPAYGETGLQNKTINQSDTNVIYCDLDDKIYTADEYNDIYNDYLKMGGKALPGGFGKKNLIDIITFKQKQN